MKKKRVTKLIAAMLIAALFVTNTPECFAQKVLAAERTWKILEEKDLPVDELYGWYPDYDSASQFMIGRKDGMIAFLDSSLNLVKKTKYDQLEEDGVIDDTDYNLLVSRQVGSESEYAVIDKTGKETILGTYKKAESLGLVGEPILYAEKVNGECGFLVDGKEIGFDKNFVDKPEEAVICYNITWLGKSMYYVKQYFETTEVYDRVGEMYAGSDLEEIKEKLNDKKCEFIFYDNAGKVVDSHLLIEECEQEEKNEEEQQKKDVQVIAELRQSAASQLPIREYIKDTWTAATGKFTVNDVTAYRFGQGYLAYVKTDVEVLSEGYKQMDTYYFAGFFDLEKKVVTSGQVIAANNEDYWDEGIYLAIRDSDKKIYFYGDDEYVNTGYMVKYLYADTDGIFTDAAYELPSAYPNDVVISGYGETDYIYLAASPTNDFVRITSMYTALKGNNGLKARHAILNEEGGKKEIVFYDSAWKNVIKRINVSRLPGDIKLCDGIVLGKTCAALYKTGRGQYGLIGMDGNIVVDAEKEGYEYGSVESGYFEKPCVSFEKDDVRYYYYDGDFIPHTEEEYEEWQEEEEEEGGNGYGDITYDKEWIEDGTGNTIMYEKVLDSDGNVLVSHEVPEDVYKNDRCEDFIYIFKDSRSIVVVDRHWNGKRGDASGENSPKPPSVTAAPEASPNAGATRSPLPAQTPDAAPTFQPTDTALPIDPDETAVPETTADPSPAQTPQPVPDIPPTQIPQPLQPPAQTMTPPESIQIAPPLIIEPEDEDEEEEEDSFKKGDCFMSGNLGYQVTKRKGKKGEIAVVLVKSNQLKKIVVPKQVKKNGITFSVTSIEKNAFKGCKKAKTLQIKSLNIKSISKKALTGINKRVVIKVPRKKYWAYRIMLRKGGYYTIRR